MNKYDSSRWRDGRSGGLYAAGRLLIRFIELLGRSFIAVLEATFVILVLIGVGLMAVILFKLAVKALATMMGSN